MKTIEKKNSSSENAYNAARIAHGTMQLARGALTGDILSAVKGVSKLISTKTIILISSLVVFIILLPVIILAAIPQVLFSWGTLNDKSLQDRKAYADYLVTCYEGAENYKAGEIRNILEDLSVNNGAVTGEIDANETDILWLIAIDSVRHKQNVMTLNASEIQNSIRRSLDMQENRDENGNLTSVSIKNKEPESIMTELGFSDDEKNWARLMYSSMTYGQYLDTNSDYTETAPQDGFQGTLGEGETQVTYYNQMDNRWKDKLYGRAGTIGNEGCGPTAVAIVASTFTGKTITPVDAAKWSADNGYRCIGSGSYHSLIPAACKHYGLNVKGLGNSSAEDLAKHLSEGKLIIALMKKGHFTSSGHFIVLRGITAEKKVLVADPASFNRSNQTWDISIIINESSTGAAAGGPFWSIS